MGRKSGPKIYYDAKLEQEFPDGTLRYRIVKVGPHGSPYYPVKVHQCPHCGGAVYYRFETDGSVVLEAYLGDKPQSEEG